MIKSGKKNNEEVKPVLTRSINIAKPCKKKDEKVKPVLTQSINTTKPCKKKDKEVKPVSVQSIKSKAVGVQNTKPTQIKAIELKIPKIKSRKTKVPNALSDSNRHDLERRLGHTFHDPNLLWEALQAHGNGVVQIGERKIGDGNKKMAMLGDSILQLALLSDWFDSGKSRKSGNTLLCSIASNRNLDKCGHDNKLEVFINPHKSFVKGQIPPRTMAATVEALIGAVFIDSGEDLEAVKIAMIGLGLIR